MAIMLHHVPAAMDGIPLPPAGAATASINYYRALMRCLTYAPIPSVWRALHAQLPLPCCAIMAADDPALDPGLMNKLDQVR